MDHEPEAVKKKRKTKDNEPKETTKRKCNLLIRQSFLWQALAQSQQPCFYFW